MRLRWWPVLPLILLLPSILCADGFCPRVWRSDARNLVRLENVSSSLRKEIAVFSTLNRDARHIDGHGHVFIDDVVDRYARLRRLLHEIQDTWCHRADEVGFSADERLRATLVWLGATAILLENASCLVEAFEHPIWRRRVNVARPGRGSIQVAAIYDDMHDLLHSTEIRRRVKARRPLADLHHPLVRPALAQGDGALLRLIQLFNDGSEINRSRTQGRVRRVTRTIRRRVRRVHDHLGALATDGVTALVRLLRGDAEDYVGKYGDEGASPAADLGPSVRQDLFELLEPGDIIFTMTRGTLTSRLIPGFWSHTALWIGSDDYLAQHGVYDALRNRQSHSQAIEQRDRIRQGRLVLEAVTAGVIVAPIESVLNNDVLAVARLRDEFLPPGTTRDQVIADTIKRGFRYLGKDYDFWFDVNDDSRVVCSELIFKSFPPTIRWPTVQRLGRPTVSPDNIAIAAGPATNHPLRVIYFVDEDGARRGANAWQPFWQNLRETGWPFTP